MERFDGVRIATEEHGRHLARIEVEVNQMDKAIEDHEYRIRGAEKTLTRVAVIAGVVAAVGAAGLSLVVRLIGG